MVRAMAASAAPTGVAIINPWHEELDRRIREYFGGDVTPAHLKMADAPSGAPVHLGCPAAAP